MNDRAPDLNDPGFFAERRFAVAVAVDRLCEEFHGVFARGSVERCLRECEQMLRARGPRGAPNFLPLLADRFARDRLRAIALIDGHVARVVPEALFVCVRNAGRSQIAAALTHHMSSDWVHVLSAGSHPTDRIDPKAFAILDVGAGGVDVTIERVAYDAAAVADEVRRAGLPSEFADKLVLAT